MINWIYFPRSDKPTPLAVEVVRAFELAKGIDSAVQTDNSNFVLRAVSAGLQGLGFTVEVGKKTDQKISVPVLFEGERGHSKF